jgi:hypothetical protein
VLYLHCFNHRLHLVIIDTIEGIPEVADMFETCRCLYEFFKLVDVRNVYEGQTLKGLLTQRWSGHLQCLQAIVKSNADILECLEYLSSSKCKAKAGSDIKVKAVRYKVTICSPYFLFLSQFCLRVLEVAEPVNRCLQCITMDISSANDLILSLQKELNTLRSEDVLNDVLNSCCNSCINTEHESVCINERKRKRVKPSWIVDFVITENVGCTLGDSSDTIDTKTDILRVAHEVIDRMLSELNERFCKSNIELMSAIGNLVSTERSVSGVAPLLKLLSEGNIVLKNNDVDIEFQHFANLTSTKPVKNLEEIISTLKTYTDAFPCFTYLVHFAFHVALLLWRIVLVV